MSDETNASLLNEGNNGDADTTTVETTQQPTWTEQVDSDLKADTEAMKILGGHGKLTSAARRLVELEGNAANSIIKPGESATDDEVSAYLNALGRPETSDKYEFVIPNEVPESMRMGDDELSALKGELHAEGFTQKQGDFIMGKFNNILITGDKMQKDATAADLKAGQEAITEAWGDDAKANLEKANRVISKFGGDDFKSFLKKAGLDNSPEVFMVFHKMSTVMSEDTMMEPIEKGTGEMERAASGRPLITKV